MEGSAAGDYCYFRSELLHIVFVEYDEYVYGNSGHIIILIKVVSYFWAYNPNSNSIYYTLKVIL